MRPTPAELAALALMLLGNVYLGLYALDLPVGPLWVGPVLVVAALGAWLATRVRHILGKNR